MNQTHFGFKKVNEADKAKQVAKVFDSVASKYDIM
ncbi:MAG: demethylmenaquinone methyltransferase/2-methoxy-6-polyprenyl-1,4-benzoquinol methylase, partial [Burkholderiaceae bacterium]